MFEGRVWRVTGVMLLAVGSQLGAAIVANFDGAPGDGYPSSAGSGWAGGWVINATSNETYYSAGVGSSLGAMSPGGGNYLGTSYDFRSGTGRFTLNRHYVSDSGAGVDLTKPHTVSLRFRLNSSTSGWTDQFGQDSLAIYDDTSGNLDFPQATTWSLSASSYADGVNPPLTLWTRGVNTGMVLTQGVVYAVTIYNYPASRSFDITIDNGSKVFSATGLPWSANAQAVGGYLNIAGMAVDTPTVRQFSIDSVSISGGVPEPTALGLLASAGLLVMCRRRS